MQCAGTEQCTDWIPTLEPRACLGALHFRKTSSTPPAPHFPSSTPPTPKKHGAAARVWLMAVLQLQKH